MQQRNFAWLLSALLVFLIVIPIAEDFGFITGRVMRVAMFSWLLVFGVFSLRGFGALYKVGLALAITGTAFSVAAANSAWSYFGYASLAALAGFIAVAVWCTGQQIVAGTDVSKNRVIGAVNLYLLLGVFWSTLYAIIEKVVPGSFAGLSEPLSQGWSSDWIYFSFVTMTTLGYGDIVPLSATARTLAYLQAVFGQFYLAILVAGLIGTYIARRFTQ